MFATCVYCTSALGANESIDVFPVGRTLAFDGARGRLWVVCPRCARWNLSPLEERWEAIEACERLYRSTPLRASTEQIGLAKLREGTQLVRIGAPSRPEFAAWRYGREFARRRRVRWAFAGLATTAVVASMTLDRVNPGLASSLPLLGALPQLTHFWALYRQWLKPVARVPFEGRSVILRSTDVANIRLETDATQEAGWRMSVLHGKGRSLLVGNEAQRTLGRVLTHVNDEGGSAARVDTAVRALVDAGTADAFVRSYVARRGGVPGGTWSERQEARSENLALEMALHEDTERIALEGELGALQAAWQEADEIAAIADNLLLPSSVADRFRALRRPDRA